MSYNIGLNIVETDGRATPSIQPAQTSVAALIIRSERGIPGNVYQVTNWTEFQEHFGSFTDGAYGAYAVQGFFANGGTMAYITRVVKTERKNVPVAAIAVTQNEPTWDLSGINTPFRIVVDGESVDVVFKELSQAELVSKEEGAGFDLAAMGEFSLWVNQQEHTYTFEPKDFEDWPKATAKEIAAVLNREIPGIQAWVKVAEDVEGKPAKLHLRTDIKGVAAALKAGDKLASALGFSPAEACGGNIAILNAVTPDEVVEALRAALPDKPVSVAKVESKVSITHKEGGSGHFIEIFPGPAQDQFGFKVEPGRDGDLVQEAKPAAGTFGNLTVTAGYRGNPDPGRWGGKIGIAIARNKNNQNTDLGPYDLFVEYDGKLVETYENVHPNSTDPQNGRDPEKVINDPFTGSKFIKVAVDLDPAQSNPPVTAKDGLAESEYQEINGRIYVRLRPGADDELNLSENELLLQTFFEDSLKLFDPKEIQLVCCPESHHIKWVNAALAYCKNRGDCMFVGHTPQNRAVADVPEYSKQFQGDNVYGALYFPWIQVADSNGKPIMIPPTGHIMGIYARTERERGIWKAPAGNAAKVYGALDVEQQITDVQHTILVKDGSVNAVRFISGQGIVIDSSRTLSTSTLWLYVNVRLLFNFVKSSLKLGLRWVVQEPNNEALWNKIKYNSATPFLMGLWRQGAFGPGSPEQVFTVKVDAENNPPANIQQGILTVEVYFYPSRPAETIIISVGQQEGGATAGEK